MFAGMVRRLGLGGAVIGLSLLASVPASARPRARTTAENRAVARSAARRLLAGVPLPPGAVPSATEPSGDAGVLGFSSRPAGEALVDDHRFVVVPATLGSVEAFYAAHPPAGTRPDGTGSSGGPGIPANLTTTYAVTGSVVGLAARSVIVNLVALGPDSSGIRIDAQATWLVVRSPSERVPAGVRSIAVTESRGRRVLVRDVVRRARPVASIAHWIDALPIVQPGVFSCPAQPAAPTVVRLVFRDARARPLAAAAQDLGVEAGMSPCDSMTLSIRGRAEPSLLDGGAFLRRAGALLGIDLQRSPPSFRAVSRKLLHHDSHRETDPGGAARRGRREAGA